MTEYSFSDTLRPAFTFAHHLLAGTLNMQPDYDQEGAPLVDLKHETRWFSTDVVETIRVVLHGLELSRLTATDIADNPETAGVEGRIRSVKVYAKDSQDHERMVAAFDVEQDYLDGEKAVGWTRWQVTNVIVFVRLRMLDGDHVKLVPEQIDCHDDYVVWGRIVRP